MGSGSEKHPKILRTISNAASRLGEFPSTLEGLSTPTCHVQHSVPTGRGSSLLTIVEPVTSCQNALRSSSKDQPSGGGGLETIAVPEDRPV